MAQAITRLILRALWGQIATQRIQEMQSCSLTCFTLVLSMADTGHFAAHKPQLEHAFGWFGNGAVRIDFSVRSISGNLWFSLFSFGDFFAGFDQRKR